MSYYGHDMDHDGKITGKDNAMFHEMMDHSCHGRNNAHRSVGDIIGEGVMLVFLAFAAPLVLLCTIGFIGSLLR